MRAQRPVSVAQMTEAVRRGLITTEQMEALLALARSDAASGEARLPDLRWTATVSALAAAVAVLAPGLALLSDASLDQASLAAASAAALVACAVAGRVARARAWGRATAAILTAGVAPYAGGVATGLAGLALRRANAPDLFAFPDDHLYTLPDAAYRRGFSLSLLAATLVASVVAIALWRGRRNAPALAVAGLCAPFAAMSAARALCPDAAMTPFRLVVIGTALACLAATALRPSWGRRDGVDGAAWWELGAFGAAAVSVTAGFSQGLGGLAVWGPAALLVGALGLATRRWTWQLAGALGLLLSLALALRGEPAATQAPSLVGACFLIAAAAQWHRRRAPTVEVADERSYWE